MKKRICWIVLLLAVAVSFSSCLSFLFGGIAKTTRLDAWELDIDETLPAEGKATVTFINGSNGFAYIRFFVNEWGDFDIFKDLYKPNTSSSKTRLIVPAGPNRFLFQLHFEFSNQYRTTVYSIEDYILEYSFEAQGVYEVKGRVEQLGFLGITGTEFYLDIYDVKSGTPQLLHERKLGTRDDFTSR